MTRRDVLATPLLAAAPRRPPNVVILFADDLRYDTIRALGNNEIETPNLDRLAARGVSFTNACIMGGTSGAVCIPSRAMLHSGMSLFHAHDSIVQPDVQKAKPYTLLGRQFGSAGYRTFGTGKWHNQPALFAESFQSGSNIFFGGMTDQTKVPVRPYDPAGAFPKSTEQITARHATELFTDSAVEFLKEAPRRQPFFLYVAYTSPHDPRTAPEEFRRKYDPARISLPRNFLPQHPFDNGELKVRDELLAPFPRTPEVIRQHIADYYACISHLDSQVGRVLQALESNGQASNTIVVFAGDNGLALGQHGLMGKQSVYDHSVRVPLLMAGPGLPSNQRRADFAYLFDLYPTLCDLCGVEKPSSLEGRSLVKPLPAPDSVFFAYRNYQRAVRTREWKYIEYSVDGRSRRQLFNIRSDPWEMNDLSSSSAQVASMKTLLSAWQKKVDDPLLR
jgi:arylsulfatase A-like enzyme